MLLLFVDLSVAMLHGGVVPSPKLAAQLWKGQLGVRAGHVHRDVPRPGERSRALGPRDVGGPDAVKASHGFDDRCNSELIGRGSKEVRQLLLRKGERERFVVEVVQGTDSVEDSFEFTDVARDSRGNRISEVAGNVEASHFGFLSKDREQRFAIWSLHIGEQAAFEACA